MEPIDRKVPEKAVEDLALEGCNAGAGAVLALLDWADEARDGLQWIDQAQEYNRIAAKRRKELLAAWPAKEQG